LFYYGFKKDALGGGDIKLTGAVGLLLGWERLLLAIVIASLSACVILLIASRRASSAQGEETSTPTEEESGENEVSAKEYPFAPFLCTGFWVALTFGASVIGWYLSLFGL
jgi:prepilin signal peptidase PulO-like enzyme (type II secretory pathway)